VRRVVCCADKLGECDELSGVPEEATVLDGDPVKQIVKCARLRVDHVDVRLQGDPRKACAFGKQSLQSRATRRLYFQAGTRLDEQRGAVERA
jgi:hypothetical protein